MPSLSFFARLALRRALRMVGERAALPARDIALNHNLLVVLPQVGEQVVHAWGFVEALQVAPADLTLISCADEPLTAPSAFIQRIRYLRSKDYTWAGLPKRSFLETIWSVKPRFAIDLNREFFLPGALLVGASPAMRRIGFFDSRAEPFFDWMLKPGDSTVQSLSVLKDYLGMIEPSLVRRADRLPLQLAEF